MQRKCVATRDENGVFVDMNGSRIDAANAVDMHRIGISPSYTDVCVLPKSSKRLRALATDSLGTRQYFYSKTHSKTASDRKFQRVAKLAGGMQELRAKFRNLMLSDNPKSRAVGLSMIMCDELGMRPGKKNSARKESYGATTLIAGKHITFVGDDTVQFTFPGKKKVVNHATMRDAEFARAMREAIKEGTYFSGGAAVDIWHPRVMPKGVQPKDLRTLAANRFMLELAHQDASKALEGGAPKAPPPKRAKQLLAKAAARIGHSNHVCQRSYISPKIIRLTERILAGETLSGTLDAQIARELH